MKLSQYNTTANMKLAITALLLIAAVAVYADSPKYDCIYSNDLTPNNPVPCYHITKMTVKCYYFNTNIIIQSYNETAEYECPYTYKYSSSFDRKDFNVSVSNTSWVDITGLDDYDGMLAITIIFSIVGGIIAIAVCGFCIFWCVVCLWVGISTFIDSRRHTPTKC